MARFVQVYIQPAQASSSQDVEEKMNLALDWFRYAPGTYVVYTTSDADRWYARLAELAKPNGSLFICELNIENRQGWMQEAFWKWIEKRR